MKRPVPLLFAAVLAAMTATTAHAQIPLPGADPIYGTVDLASDFRPDPYEVAANAGGPVDASTLGGDCVGWISEAPTFSVTYSPETGR
ncbi:MAG: hypothetical protein IT534_02760 [Bauldia sp.]|nr:hypothetical protein [Bauldia sp.]